MGTCSSCSAECGFGSKYCSKCGKPLRKRFQRGDESPMLKPVATPNISIDIIKLDPIDIEENVSTETEIVEAINSNINCTKLKCKTRYKHHQYGEHEYAVGIDDVLFGLNYSKKGTVFAQWRQLPKVSLNCKHIFLDKQTDYANVIATAIRTTQCRIIGIKPPNHSLMVKNIVSRYGYHQENMYKVLKKECSKRKLKCIRVNVNQAKNAIFSNRVVVGAFYLDNQQWTNFANFYKGNKTGILTRKVLGFNKGRTSGHSVCITGFNQNDNCWKIRKFGDNGHFKLKLGAIIHISFYDVFYRTEYIH